MAKKRRSTRKKKLNRSPQRPWWLWAIVATAIVLVVGGLSALLINNTATPESGTPKLVVERTEVDEGYQTYNTPVRTAFKIRNEGDGPLHILGEPQVQLVEGCWPPRAVVSSTTVKPGQEAVLWMDYTMHKGMEGPHRFDVKVRTNDPQTPELVLVAKSNWGP